MSMKNITMEEVEWARKYIDGVSLFLVLRSRRDARRAQLQTSLKAEGASEAMGAAYGPILDDRYASDPILANLQAQMDRAATEATMYGIGAIIANLTYLTKQVF
jgi:hypothetical protein